MMLYVHVNGPKKIKTTPANIIAVPVAKMNILHVVVTAILKFWNENTANTLNESSIIAHVASLLSVSVGASSPDPELHPLNWVLIPALLLPVESA